MKKRLLSLVLSTVLIATMITGCSSTASKGDSTAGENTAGQSSQSSTVEPVKEASGKTVKIEFFNQKSEIKDVMDEIIADFEKANPNIDVEHIQVPDAGEVLTTRMASDEMPDVVSIYPNETKFKSYVDEGFFMDLTGEDFYSNLNSTYVDSVKYNDKDWSVPLTMNAYGIYYNADKFNELGIKVPETWSELVDAVSKIKEAGLLPFATSFKDAWTTGHLTEALLGNTMGIPAANEFFSSDVPAADSKEFKKFTDHFNLFIDNTEEDTAGTDYNTAVTLFATGDALMLPQGIWATSVIESAGADFDYQMMPVPADTKEDTKVVYGIDFAVGISASTPNAEAAKTFVSYLTTTEVAQKLHDAEKSPSIVNGVEAKNTETVAATQLLMEGKAYPWIHFDWIPENDPNWQDMTDSYAITKDMDILTEALDSAFGK
ncbi:MAG: extracellular solute-binding protein [Anaerocolumna sp.]